MRPTIIFSLLLTLCPLGMPVLAQTSDPEAPGTPEAAAAPAGQPPGEDAQEDDDGPSGVVMAPQDGPDLDEIFAETISVHVVNVLVYVTDKDGNRVTDLTKDDFEIYEDGRPMAITNFYAYEEGLPISEQAKARHEALIDESVPEPLRNPRRNVMPVPEDQRLYLVVYIDNFNIHPLHRNRVMRELRQFLAREVTREDRVMLVSYDRSLHVRQEFTSDPAIINAKLTELEKFSGFGTQNESARRQVLRDIEDARSSSEAITHVRMFAESRLNDMTFTVRALKEMVQSLSGIPGRKAVLYVSDGLPMVAAQDLFQYVEDRFGRTTALNEAFNYDSTRQFMELSAQANAARVAFYTIDAGGLRAYSSVDASVAGAPGRISVDSVRLSNLQSPLHFMANTTGGKAIVNRNRVLPALEEVADDFRTYYSLGYSPAHSGDGRLYEIDVKVKRKGLRVRHAENYRDKSVESRMGDATMAALNFSVGGNPLDVRMEFGDPRRREQDKYYLVPVVVKVPLSKVVLIPQEELQIGRLRFFVAALDERGRSSPVQEIKVPVNIPTAQFNPELEQLYTYTFELLMRSGGHKVAVGVRDELGSETAFVSRAINVAERTSRGK